MHLALLFKNRRFLWSMIVVSLLLYTLIHCLYLETVSGECILGYLGINPIFKGSSVNVIKVLAASIITTFVISQLLSWILTRRFYNLLRSYIRQKLSYSKTQNFFDPLRLAMANGIINPKIFT